MPSLPDNILARVRLPRRPAGPLSPAGGPGFEDPASRRRDSPANKRGSRKPTDAKRVGRGWEAAGLSPTRRRKVTRCGKRGRSPEAASFSSGARRGSRGKPPGPPSRPAALLWRRAGAHATWFHPLPLPCPRCAARQRAFDVAAGAPGPPSPDTHSPAMSAFPRPGLLTAAAAAALRPEIRRPRPCPGRELRAPPQRARAGQQGAQRASSGACGSRVVGRPSAR
nr:dapper homolog 3-like [Pongo pygmaeus]XP_054398826.1 dapper homolog 3-like [Pongo abelii]